MHTDQDSHWEKIAGKLHGELGAGEELEFDQLLSDNAHRAEFEKAKGIRDQLSAAGEFPVNRKLKSWTRIASGIGRNRKRWILTSLKYAAIVLFAFVAGNLVNTKTITKPEEAIHYSEIRVPYGQMSQITLSDGTQVWMNSGTTLRYPDRFGEKERSVMVTGEAFFKVAKMADRPFTINSVDLTVQVLGTSFNFSAYREDSYSSVTLVEGKVAIQDNKGIAIAQLIPGQMVTKDKSSNSLRIMEVKTASYTAWTKGEIFFDDEPLDQIAFKLERWFNVEITFDDPQLKTKRFTGTILKNKPVDQIMQALELLAPIQFKHQVHANGKDKITIYKRT